MSECSEISINKDPLSQGIRPLTEEQKALVAKHFYLIELVARGWVKSGLNWSDLIEAGQFGLMSASQYYLPEKGDFQVFARICIRRAMWNLCKKTRKNRTISLDAPLEDGNSTSLRDIIEDESALSANELAQILSDKKMIIEVNQILSSPLNMENRKIIQYLFGFDEKGVSKSPLDTVAKKLKVRRKTVEYRRRKILQKIRAVLNRDNLKRIKL
jgi:RNA polymerase sigma factor (sigma-70 family)